jgi:hypothetical protein
MVGTVGAVAFDPTEPTIGAEPGVGTGGTELTPRLPISVESSGIPVCATPPGVVDVGEDDAVTLPEPEPHMPDIPEVSTTPDGVDMPALCPIPELVDNPEVAETPVDVPGEFAVLPADAPVAGVDGWSAIPPPS